MPNWRSNIVGTKVNATGKYGGEINDGGINGKEINNIRKETYYRH